MQISGHKTEAVYQRYAIVSARDVREAGAKLDRFFDEQRTTTRPLHSAALRTRRAA